MSSLSLSCLVASPPWKARLAKGIPSHASNDGLFVGRAPPTAAATRRRPVTGHRGDIVPPSRRAVVHTVHESAWQPRASDQACHSVTLRRPLRCWANERVEPLSVLNPVPAMLATDRPFRRLPLLVACGRSGLATPNGCPTKTGASGGGGEERRHWRVRAVRGTRGSHTHATRSDRRETRWRHGVNGRG